MDLVIRHLGSIHLSLRFLHRLGFPVVVSGLLRPRLAYVNNFVRTSRASSEDWPHLHRDLRAAMHV